MQSFCGRFRVLLRSWDCGKVLIHKSVFVTHSCNSRHKNFRRWTSQWSACHVVVADQLELYRLSIRYCLQFNTLTHWFCGIFVCETPSCLCWSGMPSHPTVHSSITLSPGTTTCCFHLLNPSTMQRTLYRGSSDCTFRHWLHQLHWSSKYFKHVILRNRCTLRHLFKLPMRRLQQRQLTNCQFKSRRIQNLLEGWIQSEDSITSLEDHIHIMVGIG